MPTSRDDLLLWYTQPAAAWVEALPLGNGHLGAMVFGGVATERLQLNADTLWSGGPRDWNNPTARAVLPEVRRLVAAEEYAAADALCRQMQGPYTQAYQPLADLHLRFDHRGAPASYRRDLDLHTAIASVCYQVDDVTFTREVFVSAPDQVLVLHLRADRPRRLSLTATLTTPHPYHVERRGSAGLALHGQAPAHVAPNYDHTAEPVVYAADGKGMRFAVELAAIVAGGRVRVAEGHVRIDGADTVTLLVAAATSFQ